jgi:hypothetical protein
VSLDRKEREFDALFKDHGRRVDLVGSIHPLLNSLREAGRDWCAHMVETEYGQTDRSIYLDIVDNPSINAIAKVFSHDYIAVHSGALQALLGVLFQMLSHPALFAQVGDCTEESVQRAIGPNPFSGHEAHSVQWTLPRNEARREFAVNLATVAFVFLVMHEIGHLRNGHVDLLKTMGMAELAEIRSACPSSADPLLRHTLEIDADCYALTRCTGFVLDRFQIDLGEDSPFTRAFRCAFGTREHAVHTLFFAMYLLFRLFDPHTLIGDDRLSSHPAPGLRFSAGFHIMAHSVLKTTSGEIGVHRLYRGAAKAMVDVERALAAISSREVDIGWAHAAFNEERAIGLMADVDRKWAEIRSQLDRLKRGGVLAAAREPLAEFPSSN